MPKRLTMPTDPKERRAIRRSPVLRRLLYGGRWRFMEGAAMLLEKCESEKHRTSFLAHVLRDVTAQFSERTSTTREARAVGRLLRAVRRAVVPLAAHGAKQEAATMGRGRTSWATSY